MDEAFAHMEGSGKQKCQKEMVPPDGGWGYVIGIGVGFTFVSIFVSAPLICFTID